MAIHSGGRNTRDVYCFFKSDYDSSENIVYIVNNWIKNNGNRPLQEVFSAGGAIWLNSRGDLCYRLAYNDHNIQRSTAKKISLVFNSLFDINIEIRENPRPIKISESKKQRPIGINIFSRQILINDLLVVKDELFNPYVGYEFYHEADGFIYSQS